MWFSGILEILEIGSFLFSGILEMRAAGGLDSSQIFSSFLEFLKFSRVFPGPSARLVRPPATGRSASFRLRFRFVRAVRPGEAKLCVRVRRSSLRLGLGVASAPRLRAVWRAIFAAIRMGFKHF